MLKAMLVAALVLLPSTAAWAQAPGVFDDVPPWHWAFESVQKVATAGLFIGYPSDDHDLAVNALIEVYEAFGHPVHPAAREWAERFLTTLPPTWPQPLVQSRVLRFNLEDAGVARVGDRGTISGVATVVLRTDGGSSSIRTPLHVELRKLDGRWRVDYASLAASQPQVFR